MSIAPLMPSNHLSSVVPFSSCLQYFPGWGSFFSDWSVLCIRWPKYWSFSFSISPSNEYLGLISFRMDWLDLLAVQGTLKSLLQHHSSKASILSRLVIAFLPRSKPLWISWLQSPSAMIWEPKIKSLSLFPCFPHLLAMKWWDQMPWS